MNRNSTSRSNNTAKQARFAAPLTAPLGAKVWAALAAQTRAQEKAAEAEKAAAAQAAAALKAAQAAEAKARAEAAAAAARAKAAAEAERLRRVAARDQILDAPILAAHAGSEEEVLPGDIYAALARDLARGVSLGKCRGTEFRVRVLPSDPRGKVPAPKKAPALRRGPRQ